MTELARKVVIVTGAGRGIGAAVAQYLAALGACVVINDIDADAAEESAASVRASGGDATTHVADISDWDGAAALIGETVAAHGRLDGLVNNAGLFAMGRLDEMTKGDFDRLLAVNLSGTVHCAAHAARVMQRQRSGSIVNITSGAQMGIAGMGLYGATKGAVASLTYTWAQELDEFGIRVNAVSPMANTQMVQITKAYYQAHGLDNVPTPAMGGEANAAVIAYLLSDASAGVQGQVVRIEGNQMALVSHPAVVLPVQQREEGWTLPAVDSAFKTAFADRLVPLGFTGVDIAGYAMPASFRD